MNTQARLDRVVALTAVAAAGATVGFTQNADAAIVSSGPVNINIPSNTDGVYLNVVTGANSSSVAAVPGWDVNPFSSSGLSYFSPGAPAGGVYVQRTGGGATANLAMGTLIGGASVFGSATASLTGNNAHVLNDVNIIGFRFRNEANGNQIHFGWMKIAVGGTLAAQPRAIVEYAYEDQAGVGIEAGVVPAPGTAALLALGAVGMAGRRRK
jgi:hypothetical protein